MQESSNGWIDNSIDPGGDPERLILVWHVFLECWTDRARKWKDNQFYTHWQEAPTEGWIRTKDRMPTEDDADGMNCIIVSNDDMTILRVTGWHQMPLHREYTRWRQTIKGPPEYKTLKTKY